METNTANTDTKTALFILFGCSFSLITFIGGLVVGLVVFGWLLWPVEWVDAAPLDLRHEYQVMYVDMVVDAFETDHDLSLARYRLHPWNEEQALKLLYEVLDSAATEDQIERVAHIRILIDSYDTGPQ